MRQDITLMYIVYFIYVPSTPASCHHTIVLYIIDPKSHKFGSWLTIFFDNLTVQNVNESMLIIFFN